MLPIVTHPQPSPSPSPRRAVGLRAVHRTPEPTRVPGCVTLGFLEVLQAPCPSHLAGLEQGQGCQLEMKRRWSLGWGWESGVCDPPGSGKSGV